MTGERLAEIQTLLEQTCHGLEQRKAIHELVSSLREMEQIIEWLVVTEPIGLNSGEEECCVYCGTSYTSTGRGQHNEGCAWIAAKEYVAANRDLR